MIENPNSRLRKTKIVCTIGPDPVGSCSDTDEMFKTAYACVLQKGNAKFGDRLLIIARDPIGL